MARVERPVVGTLDCATCGSLATLHQAARASRKGLLYVRCPECGCDQRTGAKIQTEWRQAMTPRPGFEHLAEPKPEPEPAAIEPKPEPNRQPSEPGQAGVSAMAAEPKPEPKTEPGAEPIAPKSGPMLGLLAVLGGITLVAVGYMK